MASQTIITDHDRWRKGAGGKRAGLSGESDSSSYSGLDLNLAQFATSTFSGSSFTATTFKKAEWSNCQFNSCTFSACDFEGIVISGCTFVGCTFSESQFDTARLSGSTFRQCTWNALNFDNGSWSQVDVLGCNGCKVVASNLRGQKVDFTGSQFEDLQFNNVIINS